MRLTALELCACAGGQALGVHRAGFKHVALIDNDAHACQTLKRNFKSTRVIRADIRKLRRLERFRGVDLIAGGLPCPPFSIAGKQLGASDERNLFPAMFEIVRAARPKAVMIENVAGLMHPKFEAYRSSIRESFAELGYKTYFKLLNAADFGVPQRRQRVIIVALRRRYARHFSWPAVLDEAPQCVAETVLDLMKADGWAGADRWARRAVRSDP